jgi:hypothetical protein
MNDKSSATAVNSAMKPSLNADKSGLLQRKCDCGNAAGLTGECSGCQQQKLTVQRQVKDGNNMGEVPLIVHEFNVDRGALDTSHSLPRMPMMQAKLTIGDSDDPLEREADRVADRVMSMSPNSVVNSAPPSIQRFTGQTTGQAGMLAPASVDSVLSNPGIPLEPGLQQDMGQRFGHDFSQVRVHTDAAAARSARDVNANAYTVGNNVVFGSGQFAPGYHGGLHLLAHELTHVVQQSGSDGTYVDQGGENRIFSPIMQRKKGADNKAAQRAGFYFSVKVSNELNSEELLVEFVRQYYQLGNLAEATKMQKENNWKWINKPKFATKADAEKGYILLYVTDNSIKQQDEASKKKSSVQFGQLGDEDQSAINSEADREFWEKSQYKVRTQLGDSSDDKKMSEYWILIRNELVRQRKAIDALPPNIKKFLFKDGAPRAIEPKDYATALRIAEKLSKLTDAEIEDYKSKVNTQTSDWSMFEGSIDSFVEERSRRKEEAKDLDKKKTKIYGIEELYKKYKTWKDVEGSAQSTPAVDEFGIRDPNHKYFQQMEDDTKADLLANLPRYGFKSIEDFEQAITDYEDAFARETVNIAFDMLAKYDHLLYEEEKKYSNKANADALAQAIGKTTAKADYESAASSESAARGITRDPELHRYMPGEFEMKMRLEREGASSLASAESQVNSAAASVTGVPEPLIGNKDFDREKLARADASQVQSLMLEYIAARRTDVGDMRGYLSGDPDLIYKLDDLWKASKEQQHIRSDTIYDLIIADKISRVHRREALIKILQAVFTVALSIVSFGTGTIAAVAAVGAFGLSAYQALESFKEYEVGHAAAGAQLLSDDPSFAWVIVAFVGAAIDLGMAYSSIKSLTPAIKVFNETHDLAKFEKSLAELKVFNETHDLSKSGKSLAELADIESKLKKNLLKAAKNEVKYQETVADFMKVSGKAYASIGIPDPEALWKLSKVAYAALKKGINTFDKFLLELKAQKIIKNMEALTVEEKLLYQKAWLEVLNEDTRLAKIQMIGERMPVNAEDFAGKVFSFDLTNNPVAKTRLAERYAGTELATKTKAFEDLAKKYPDGVKFTSRGFPDFTPYTVKLPNGSPARFPLKTAGNRSKDFTAVDKLAGITEEYRQANELVWHHMEDMETIILIPRDVHNTVKHSGGISVFTNTVIEE